MNKCIIVDDSPIILKSLSTQTDWEGYGFQIIHRVTDPVRALQYIAGQMDTDLLVTDIVMPEMTGLELIEKARAIRPALSVIVISAFDEFEYVRKALKLGVENYLLKPIDTEELNDTLRQIAFHLEEHRLRFNPSPLHTFKSNLTERWLHNAISPHELTDKAELLGVSMDVGQFRAISLYVPSGNVSDAFTSMRQALAGKICGYPFFEEEDLFTLVLYDMDVPALLEEIASSLEAKGISISAVIGRRTDFYGIHNSYHDARLLRPILYASRGVFTSDFLTADFKNSSDLEALKADIKKLLIRNSKIGKKQALSACVRLFELAGAPDQYDVATIKAFPAEQERLPAWLGTLISNVEARIQRARCLHPCVLKTLDTIRNSYGSELSLKTLADSMGVSSAYLGKLFLEQMHMHFNDYLLSERLKHACLLLRESTMPMNEIASKCGFASQTYFNRSFKRIYGMSPLAYKHTYD